MRFRLVAMADVRLLEPLTCRRPWADCPVAGTTLGEAIRARLGAANDGPGPVLSCGDALWPSRDLAVALRQAGEGAVATAPDGTPLAWISADGALPARPATTLPLDDASRLLRHPWDILAVNEDLVGALDHDEIHGTVRPGVTIDGHAVIGEGTLLLPGVYIEGNIVIGRNCKIGPNCYFRGSTAVGDGCHIGQAVEIKNSLLMDRVGAGHLSYVGDSVVGVAANLGAGTITANFRHDGRNHRAMAGDVLVDTGRRKLGAIIGDDVHTGIHTGIYPGRKIWPGLSTRPGDIVQRDLRP